MANKVPAYVVLPAVFLAGGLALYGVEQVPRDAMASSHHASTSAAATDGVLPMRNDEALPPNHPSIGAGATPEPMGSLPAASHDPPALVWKAPATWQDAPNPNAMRLATYHVPGGVEVTVSRAGGETEANIQRWVSQFDDVGHEGHAEKTVHGLHVVTVDIGGTYVGGGASMGGPAEPKADWALVGAIVESRSPSYFFKMTGPAAGVRAARASFDHFLDGLTPSGS